MTALWDDRSLKSQMKQADRVGATYTVIIGNNEITSGKYILRRMGESAQIVLSPSEILPRLKDGDFS